MDSVIYYTTIGTAFDYLVEYHQETGGELTFPAALEGLRQRGGLSRTPPAFPPFHSNMDREEFRAFVRALPVQADRVLEELYSFTELRETFEASMFPKGKDVFSFLNMPHLGSTPHSHDFFEITYVLNGGCTFFFEGSTVSLSEGDVCITSPRAEHSQPLEPDCFALSIVVRKSTFNSIFSGLLTRQDLVSLFFRNSLYTRPQANFILLHTGGDQDVFHTAQTLTFESNQDEQYANACAVSLLNLFLIQALRASQTAVTLHHYENYSERGLDFTLVLRHIQQNYQTVTLSSLAETFHFSETYLSKLIHRNMGRSFTEVLRTLKMDRAMDFLMNTPMKVSEIAAAVGYGSVDHFSRTFRRAYGMSPQRYRQAHAADAERESPTTEGRSAGHED